MRHRFGRVREAQGRVPTFRELRTRAVGPERTLARVCREFSATVRMNTKLRDMNVAVEANDEQAIEVLATGLPLHQRAQLAVDITLRSALTAMGLATPGAAHTDGVVLQRARADKERKYAELLHCVRCLSVGSCWVGDWRPVELRGRGLREPVGRAQGARCLSGLARVFFAWLRRWQRMLSVSCATAFACSLVRSRSKVPDSLAGNAPDLADLFAA